MGATLYTLKETPEASQSPAEARKEEWDQAVRFFDLLEPVEGEVSKPCWGAAARNKSGPVEEDEFEDSDDELLGPRLNFGETIQSVVQALSCKELKDLDFPFTISASFLKGCPLVLCSAGFTDLTGHVASNAVGQPVAGWEMLLRGAPPNWVDAAALAECKQLCEDAEKGGHYKPAKALLSEDGLQPEVRLSLVHGELVCVQGQVSSSGKLFRSVNLMKQVEIENATFMVSLQVPLPDELPAVDAGKRPDTRAQSVKAAYQRLQENLDSAEQVLAAQLWYSAPMRRQKACDPEEDLDGPSSGSGAGSRCR
jgi:hypothetical protein